MIPGLMDSHAHFLRHGQRPGYDVRAVEAARSIADFQAALSAKAEEVPEGALITVVTGWNPIQLAENRMPTMAELDEALPNNPAYVHYAAYGPAVTNTAGKALFEEGLIPVAEDGVLPGFAHLKGAPQPITLLERASGGFDGGMQELHTLDQVTAGLDPP